MTVEIAVPNPASNTAIVAGDHDVTKWTMIRQTTGVSQASWSTTNYNDFPLIAAGLANISKTGISKFGTVSNYDLDNTAPTCIANQNDTLDYKTADTALTTSDPKLTVTFSVGTAANNFGMFLFD